MTKLEYFNECTKGPWNETKGMVTWKIVDGVMYFQCSNGEMDWGRNLDIMPTVTKIKGISFFIPRGLDASWEEIKPILKENHCIGYIGYSLGAELASLASAYTGRHAIAFACPNFILGKLGADNLFWNVDYVCTVMDLLARIPLGYRKGSRVALLRGKVTYPAGLGLLERLSGHSPKAYRQLLGAV